jgi:hypothetical protein
MWRKNYITGAVNAFALDPTTMRRRPCRAVCRLPLPDLRRRPPEIRQAPLLSSG